LGQQSKPESHRIIFFSHYGVISFIYFSSPNSAGWLSGCDPHCLGAEDSNALLARPQQRLADEKGAADLRLALKTAECELPRKGMDGLTVCVFVCH